MRAQRPASVVAVIGVLLLGLVAGCGGGVGARPWAAAVCEALTPWRSEITSLNRRAQQQMTAETTPAQAKENLLRLVSGAEAASETARAKVVAAGTPAVPGGGRAARAFVDSLTAVRDAYHRARESLRGLETAEPKIFYDGVRAVMERLNTEYARTSPDTSSLDSPELERAFDEVPECR
ncbi:MAG: hypothetical protein IRZ05_04970 [Micromonosporaceae bacterium]|nr:hypothetical protein [Micromonosporaceae bacterium]